MRLPTYIVYENLSYQRILEILTHYDLLLSRDHAMTSHSYIFPRMKRTWSLNTCREPFCILYTFSHELGTRHARDQLISTPDCFENSLCLILPPLSLEAGEK